MTDADAGLDAALDRLYGTSLDEFVAVRDALAKELRAGGDRETAAAVKKVRKPSVAAWAVNQLARRHGDEVTALLDATERLRRAQRRAVSGAGAGGLREAAAEQRAAVARLVERSGAVLDEAGHGGGAQLDRVAAILQAAPAGADTAERLARGRLERDLEPAGFGELEGLTLLSGEAGDAGQPLAETKSPVTTAKAGPEKAPPGQKEAAAAARRLEEAEAERERLRHDAGAAREEAVRARAEAEGAEGAAREAAETAARAATAAKAAGQRAAATEKAAEHAGRRAEAAGEAVADARRALAAALARLEE